MTTKTYTIPNISCNHCIHTIKTEVSEIPGVTLVDGDVIAKKVTISFNDPATEKKIKSLLAEINYPAAD